jgi:hypothetical protein
MHNFERNNEYNKTVDQERVVLGSNHEESAVSELGDQEPVAPPSIQTSQATKSKAALVSKTSQPKNEKDLPKESAEKSALTTKPTLEPALVISSSEGSASAISTPTSTPGKTPKSTRKQEAAKAVKASPEPSTFAKPPSSSSHTASTSGGGLFGGGISAPQPIIASPGGLFGTSAPKEIPTCGTDPVGETRPSSGFFTGFGGFGPRAPSDMGTNLFGAKSSGSQSPVPAFGLASASTALSNSGTGILGSKPASVSASEQFGSGSGSAKTVSSPFPFGKPTTGTSGNLFAASSISKDHAIK